MRNKSRRQREDQILGVLPTRRVEEFLKYFANLSLVPEVPGKTPGSLPKLLNRYPEMFGKVNDTAVFRDAVAMQTLFRRAWDARDERRRGWWLHEAETFYRKQREAFDLRASVGDELAEEFLGREYLNPGGVLYALRIPEPPETVTPLEAALFHFRRRADKARHCPNPDCLTPYFFLSRKGQKFCAPECATPARRASKLRWWHQNRAGALERERAGKVH